MELMNCLTSDYSVDEIECRANGMIVRCTSFPRENFVFLDDATAKAGKIVITIIIIITKVLFVWDSKNRI